MPWCAFFSPLSWVVVFRPGVHVIQFLDVLFAITLFAYQRQYPPAWVTSSRWIMLHSHIHKFLHPWGQTIYHCFTSFVLWASCRCNPPFVSAISWVWPYAEFHAQTINPYFHFNSYYNCIYHCNTEYGHNADREVVKLIHENVIHIFYTSFDTNTILLLLKNMKRSTFDVNKSFVTSNVQRYITLPTWI